MTEVPFRSWNTAYTLSLQAVTPARIKTKTHSIIVLRKPPNVPTLCWLLYFYFWLTVPVSWAVSSQDVVLCFRVYPEKQLMTPLGSQTPIRLGLLTGQCFILLSGFFLLFLWWGTVCVWGQGARHWTRSSPILSTHFTAKFYPYSVKQFCIFHSRKWLNTCNACKVTWVQNPAAQEDTFPK